AEQSPVRRDPIADHIPLRPVPLLEGHAALTFMVLTGHVDRMKEVLAAEGFDPRLVKPQILKAPTHFIAAERTMTEALLSGTHRFDIEDAVDDAEIVVDAADALFVFEIALAGVIDRLDDSLQHRILLA